MNKMILAVVFLLIASLVIFAQPPREMTYQGYLTDNSGNAITANLQLTFAIYDVQSGGTALWSEVHPSVAIIAGVFRVRLGSISALNLNFDAPYWLGIKVDTDPELAPRIALTGVGYSFYSLKADSAENFTGLAGGDLTGTYPDPTVGGIQNRAVSATAPATGEVLKWNGSAWVPGPDNSGSSVWTISGDDIYNSNTGKVGIGTTSPTGKLHINGSGTIYALQISGGTNYGLRADWAGSGLGSALVGINTGSAGDGIQAIGNGSGRSALFTQSTGTVDYSIYALGNKSYFEGNVGIGTTAPAYPLVVAGGKLYVDGIGGGTLARLTVEADPTEEIFRGRNDGSSKFVIEADGHTGVATTGGSATYQLYVNGSGFATGSWLGSDERYKRNVNSIGQALDKILKLNGVSFEFDQNFEIQSIKEDENGKGLKLNFPEGRQIGFIAQEVETILPEVVKTDEHGYKAIAYQNLIPLLVEAIKTQQAEIEELKSQISALK